MQQTHTITEEEKGLRLDIWATGIFPEISRSALQRAIKDGHIMVNGEVVKPKYEVRAGDVVQSQPFDAPKSVETIPDDLNIPILYEDKDMLAINKPPGIAVHPAPSERGYTVSQWFAKKYPDSAKVGDEGRPGIVHRLDKNTSGVLLLAKNETAFARLKDQFKNHRVRKEYLALVFGIPGKTSGRITRPIGRSPRNPNRRTVIETGKPAITEWKIEKTFGNDYSLLRVFIFTGRTHQIRVHMHYLGHPVVGDNLYVFKRKRLPGGVTRQLLHAQLIAFQLPSGKKKMIEADLPEDFQNLLEKFEA